MVCISQFAYSSQPQKVDHEDKKQAEQHSLNSIAISIHQAASQQNLTVQTTACPAPINTLAHEQPAHAIVVSSESNRGAHHAAAHAAAQVLAASIIEYAQPAAHLVLSPQHDEANYSECDCSDCQTAGESPSRIEYDTSSNKSIDSGAHESDDERCV